MSPGERLIASASDRAGVSADELRQAMSHFASGVTIVTAVIDDVRHAMTATAFSSVSLDPPLCLVCVGKATRFHAAALRAERWAVSILAEDQEHVARHFSRSGRDLLTQFDGVPTGSAPLSGAPLITGATVQLDCSTYARHDAGDHTLLLGRVEWTGVGSAPLGRRPLTYHQGAYGGLQEGER